MNQWKNEEGHNGGDPDKQFWALQKILTVLLIIVALFVIAYVIQSLLS